jgi:hypothetical protein
MRTPHERRLSGACGSVETRAYRRVAIASCMAPGGFVLRLPYSYAGL